MFWRKRKTESQPPSKPDLVAVAAEETAQKIRKQLEYDDWEEDQHPLADFVAKHRRLMIGLVAALLVASVCYNATHLVTDAELVLEFRDGRHIAVAPGWYFTHKPFIRYSALPQQLVVHGMAAPGEDVPSLINVVSRDGWKADALVYVSYTLNPRIDDADFIIANFGAAGGMSGLDNMNRYVEEQTRKALLAVVSIYDMDNVVIKEHIIEHQVRRLLDPTYRADHPLNPSVDGKTGMATLMEIPFAFPENLLVSYSLDCKITPSNDFATQITRRANIKSKSELDMREEELKYHKSRLERADQFDAWLYRQMEGSATSGGTY